MALPTHRVSIFKSWNNEQWSNDWLLNVASMAEGVAVADALVNFERNIHANVVLFEYYLLSTMAEGDRIFRHQAVNTMGILSVSAGTFLPLFNTMRVDMPTTDSDPCRKYFRVPIGENDQVDGVLTPTYVGVINGLIGTHFINSIAIDNVVSSKGNVVTGATVSPPVQMRQLHRRRRPKVVTP